MKIETGQSSKKNLSMNIFLKGGETIYFTNDLQLMWFIFLTYFPNSHSN